MLRDQEKLLRRFIEQSPLSQGQAPKEVARALPERKEMRPKTTEAVPLLVSRWLKENSTLDIEEGRAYTVETDRSSDVRIDDLFGGDSGTLVYSSDEEEVDMSPSPKSGPPRR